MPTINLGKKKPTLLTTNSRLYQAIYANIRWKKLRAAKFAANPLCELCEAAGRVTQTEEVHHKIPFRIDDSPARIEALAYDWNNLISLCIECHHSEHQKLRR